MKLIIAIVNNDDAHFVNTGLTSSGFHVTKISSTGGFLMNGNSTFLLGVENDQVDDALEIIKTHSKKRTQNLPAIIPGANMYSTANTKITVGGATVFVIDVEKAVRF
ncbi:MAG: cyclic-di-AMP receptor [Clostridia bacterium]|nr:cyclic-di-AMP receptor [Clostridia bacterium]MBO4428448.1 cyclic-di-AMP receptor [Clostridia bacterium]